MGCADTKINDVKVLFLDYHIKLLTIAIICSLNVSLNRQRHHLLQLTSQLTTVRYVKRTLLPTQLFIYCVLMK